MAKDGPVRIALLGAGTVGGGVARILAEKADDYTRHLGRPLVLTGALVRDTSKQRAGVNREQLSLDANDLIDDPTVDIIVEVMGGEQPALDYIRRALSNGKYVVTANKEVMAKHGPSLLALARQNGVDLLYEASVGGGIPIIAPLKRDLMGNRIRGISAIINGTTNYILTAMGRDGMDFSVALAQAQALGFAEANPANDVEGEDARYKLAILASLAFRSVVRPEDIYREGITRLSASDFRYAHEFGYAIKLLAIARDEGDGIRARVHPAFVPAGAPLAKVDGVLNAVEVDGDLTGKVNFQGPGAGSFPTTSAVIADVLDAAQSIVGGRRDPHWADEVPTRLLPISGLQTRYYIRLTAADRPGVLAKIAACLGDAAISISSVLQQETQHDAQAAELVIMTHVSNEASMQAALEELATLDVVQHVDNLIRIEE